MNDPNSNLPAAAAGPQPRRSVIEQFRDFSRASQAISDTESAAVRFLDQIRREAILAERERCAKLVDLYGDGPNNFGAMAGDLLRLIAALIRKDRGCDPPQTKTNAAG